MNNITICGRIARDPETKVVGDGIEVVTFSVAVNRYVGKDKPEATDFFECSMFGARGAAVAKYCNKGDQIMCRGQMTSNTVEKEGKKTTYWNVKVDEFDFGSKKGGNTTKEFSDTPDELPF